MMRVFKSIAAKKVAWFLSAAVATAVPSIALADRHDDHDRGRDYHDIRRDSHDREWHDRDWHDRDDRGRGRVDIDFRDRAPASACETTQVWVEPVYRNVMARQWVEPTYRMVYDHVWVEPVVQQQCDRVW